MSQVAHTQKMGLAGWTRLQTLYPDHFTGNFDFTLELKVWTNKGPVFNGCGGLSSAICNKLSWKGFRLQDCVCCTLQLIGHFTSLSGKNNKGYRWNCFVHEDIFGFIFLCSIASLFKNMCTSWKASMYVQLYILNYLKHVIRKSHFILKPQYLTEKKLLFS